MATWPDSGLGTVVVLAVNERDVPVPSAMTDGKTIPLLQDTGSVKLWDHAFATKDDVFIVNSARNIVRVFNAQQYHLDVPANADSLRSWVRQAIGPVVTSAR